MKKFFLLLVSSLYIFSLEPSFAGGSLCVGAREEPSDIFDFNSVFSFSPSFDEEPTEISSTDQEKIVRDCQSIVKEPLGNALMQSIYELLEENRKEKSADSPQKVLFFPNESTCFDASKRRKNKVGVHIGIKNTEDSEVMQITEGAECGDTEKAPQSFQQILQHELIHVYHFLKDQKSYLKNVKVSQEFMFLRDVNTFWPSLHNVEDSLKNLTLWNNTEEFLTVLGKEVEPEEEKVEEEKENFFLAAKEEEKVEMDCFSEIAFSCTTKKARAPYNTEKEASFHKKSRKEFFKSARKHRKDIINKQSKQRHAR